MQNCGEGKVGVIDNGETIVIKVDESYFEISKDGEVKGEIEVMPDDTPGELDGIGTKEDPFVIMSIEDLVFFSKKVNEGANNYSWKYVELGKTLDFNSDLSYVNPNTTEYDIYLGGDGTKGLKEQLTNGLGFMPIGAKNNKFSGIFDGKNYYIKNLFENVDSYAGLFAYIRGSTIKNINVTGKIKSTNVAGGIVGYVDSGGETIISECTNYVNVESDVLAGGIIGIQWGDNLEITRCANWGKVWSDTTAGGIIGYCEYGNLDSFVFENNTNFGSVYRGSLCSGYDCGY